MLLEVAPASFDVVQFGGVFGQPFEGEPGALGERLCGQLAGVDRPVVEHRDQGPGAFGGAVGGAELVEQGDKVGGALGGAGMHEKLTQLRFSRHACLHSPHPRQTIHPIAHSYAVCLAWVGSASGASLELPAETRPHEFVGTVKMDDLLPGKLKKGDTINVTFLANTRVHNGDNYLPGA